MTLLKIKRTKTGDWHVADCRLDLSPHVSSKRTFSDSSLASDAHSLKKRSNWRDNFSEDSDHCTGSSPVETTVLPSFKKSRVHSERLYPHKYIPDVCSLASSVDSCSITSCTKDRDALSSDADSSTILRRKVGSHTLVVRWRGATPKAHTSTLLRKKVGNYKLVVKCGGVRPQARTSHRSELKSYRQTLEEFYGNGALSWEQEGYLAELRSRLHISNDEHMNEANSNRGGVCIDHSVVSGVNFAPDRWSILVSASFVDSCSESRCHKDRKYRLVMSTHLLVNERRGELSSLAWQTGVNKFLSSSPSNGGKIWRGSILRLWFAVV